MKKIMFSDEFLLTRAVLDGRKTQTRRIVPQKELDKISPFQKEYYDATFDKLEGVELLTHYFLTEKCGKLPYNVGEMVAVAQSYKDVDSLYVAAFNRRHSVHGMTINMLDCIPNWEIERWRRMRKQFVATRSWKNKMFVKSTLMPHLIRITDVRIERLQDISDDDCLKEGVSKVVNENGIYIQYYVGQGNNTCSFENPREAFAHLINKVSRKDVWQENPYVFVYDFEIVK